MAKDYTLRLDETIQGSIDQDTLNQLIRITIAHIGPEVTWDHFDSYLASKILEDDEIFDNLHALIFGHFQDMEKSEEILKPNLLKLTFKNTQSARAFYDFTQHTFPIIGGDFPKLNDKEVFLTEEQQFFCLRTLKFKTGELPSDFLADYSVKTLRGDRHDFSEKFIKGLIPGPSNTRRLQNLRPSNRSILTIEGDGTVTSRIDRAASINSKKEGFTQIQSCTLLDPQALTPVFGFDKNRNPKLYGILTHKEDIKLVKLLIEDYGTIGRPFDCNTEKDAKEQSMALRNSHFQRLYAPDEIEIFKTRKTSQLHLNDTTNEVLARKRLNLYRTMICICADNLEARLLADDFSKEILLYYAEHAKANGLKLNPKFKIPILFYLKNTKWVYTKRWFNMFIENPLHSIFMYTRLMRKEDSIRCREINDNRQLKSMKVASNEFEYLLGLGKIHLDSLLEPIAAEMPLSLFMMKRGYIRMLLRLLRALDKIEVETLFDFLLSKGFIEKNDTIISSLIMEEAFELATKFILATESKIDDLKIEIDSNGRNNNQSLSSYIIEKGNPRHFNYLGLEKTLKKAAEKKYWVSVRLCLKEFQTISEETVNFLFATACNHHDDSTYPEIVFLFKRYTIKPTNVKEEFQKAMTKQKWNLIQLLITHYDNPQELGLGNILIEALKFKQKDVALTILKKGLDSGWRYTYGQNNLLISLLFYCIKNHLNELLPQLHEFENLESDGYSDSRYWLTVDLARLHKNAQGIEHLECENRIRSPIVPNHIKLSLCFSVFEALFANQHAIAEYRLNLKKNDNFISVMHQFSEVFEETLTLFNFFLYRPESDLTYINAFIESLVDLTLKHKDISLLRNLQALMSNKFNICNSKTERAIVSTCLNKISPNNIEIIQTLIKTTTYIDIWKKQLLQKKDNKDLHYSTEYFEIAAPILMLLLTIRNCDDSFILDDDTIKDLFEYSVITSNTFLSEIIIKDLITSSTLQEALVSKAIQSSDSRYLDYLFNNYDLTIKYSHLSSNSEIFTCLKSLIILKELQKKKYQNTFSDWDYFKLWQCATSYDAWYGRTHKEGQKLFLNLLTPRVIRHFALIILLTLYRSRFKEVYLKSFWPNLHAILNHERIRNRINVSAQYDMAIEFFQEPSEHHLPLLDALNGYFDGTDNIPDETTANSTYQEVLRILEGAVPIKTHLPFFSQASRGAFNTETYYYIKEIDDLLKRNQEQPYAYSSIDDDLIKGWLDEIYTQQNINVY